MIHKLVGIHAVRAMLQATPERIRVIKLQLGRDDDRLLALVELARQARVQTEFVPKTWLEQNSDGPHQGVFAECEAITLASEAELEARWSTFQNPLILVLDGILDPRNLGACLRSAEGAGVDAVLLNERRSAPLSAVALKAASGAVSSLYLVSVTNLARRLKWLKEQGAWVVGAAGESDTLWYQVDFTGPSVIILGGEEKGLRRLTRDHCDYLAALPMDGAVTSLNVSVASGIFLFEARRQRLLKGTSAG